MVGHRAADRPGAADPPPATPMNPADAASIGTVEEEARHRLRLVDRSPIIRAMAHIGIAIGGEEGDPFEAEAGGEDHESSDRYPSADLAILHPISSAGSSEIMVCHAASGAWL